jgi:hypothetical protein
LAPAIAHIQREFVPAAQALAFSSLRHGSLAWGSILTDDSHATVIATAINTDGKKTGPNKTI